jgi:hypothetical protein
MPYLTIRTHASASDKVVAGALIPGASGFETFDEVMWIRRMQESLELLDYLTDSVYGAGLSTLVLVDLVGADVPQDFAQTFLSFALEDLPGISEAHAGDPNLIYVTRTLTPGALETDPVWQIYRYDVAADELRFALGDAAFIHRWDQRESLSYPP